MIVSAKWVPGGAQRERQRERERERQRERERERERERGRGRGRLSERARVYEGAQISGQASHQSNCEDGEVVLFVLSKGSTSKMHIF